MLQTLENRDTPLIQRWSNPLKVRSRSIRLIEPSLLTLGCGSAGRQLPLQLGIISTGT
jgi:hypothetical protein